MTVTIIAFIMLVIFGSYVGVIAWRYGVIHSISESYYKLRRTNKDVYFTLFCWAMAACSIMLFAVTEPDHPTTAPLFFGSAAGLGFVGAARAFRRSLTETVHYVGALIGFICALAAIYLMIPGDLTATAFLILIFIGPGLMYGFKIKNIIWWLEVYLFGLIFLGLLTL